MFTDHNKPDFGGTLKSVMENDAPVAMPQPQPDMSQKKTDVVVRELKQMIVNLKSGLVQALAELDKRMADKMQELTTAHGEIAGTTTALQKRVEELSQEFDAKAAEVDQVLAKVQEMLPDVQGNLNLSQALDKVASHLKSIKKDLMVKTKEANKLRDSLDDVRASAHADMTDLQQQLNDLDEFSQEVEQKLNMATKRLEELETEKSAFGRMKIDKTALGDPRKPLDMAHVSHFGRFNLQEHLERARKAQNKTKGELND